MQACPRKAGSQHPRVFQFATFGEFQDALQCFALLSFYVGEREGVSGRGGGGYLFVFLFSKVSYLEHARETVISNCSVLQTVYY